MHELGCVHSSRSLVRPLSGGAIPAYGNEGVRAVPNSPRIVPVQPGRSPVSIVVPTFREAANLKPLVERAFSALRSAGIEGELIVVDDDSRDGTEQIIESLREAYPVRLIVRRGERGLSGAVLEGFRHTRFDLFVVLDADLQHPPERVPDLVRKLDDPSCDFVIATRYALGGSIAQSWPWYRRWGSRAATRLARPLAPITDPMSGFFAVRRQSWEKAASLNPIGYKIALELYVKCGCRNPAEVPIPFGLRVAGESKAGFREGSRYFRHLIHLYGYRISRWFRE